MLTKRHSTSCRALEAGADAPGRTPIRVLPLPGGEDASTCTRRRRTLLAGGAAFALYAFLLLNSEAAIAASLLGATMVVFLTLRARDIAFVPAVSRPSTLPHRARRVLLRLAIATIAVGIAAVAISANAQAAVPVTYTVTSTADQADINPGDGTCSTGAFSGNTCTLRAAILEANAHPGADTILFGLPGVFALGIPVTNDDTPASGDFDLMDPVTIRGNAVAGTIIDGGTPPENNADAVGMDRLFEIHPQARNVTFEDLTLREGSVDGDGAAIQNWSSGVITLNRVQVLRNQPGGAGAVNNADPFDYDWLPMDPIPMPPPGRIEIIDSLFKNNSSGAGGSAINNQSGGYISIFNSDIVDNPGPMIQDPLDPEEMIPAPGVLPPDSTPIANEGHFDGIGTIWIGNSRLRDNFSEHDGGAVANLGDGNLIIENSLLADNATDASGGAVYSNGGKLTIKNSIVSGNTAHDGGGIYSVGSATSIGLRPKIAITDTEILNNHSLAGGGGMSSDGEGHLTLTDNLFKGNKAGDDGGGLNNGGRASMIVTRVDFIENESNNEGGGAWTGSERLVTIQDSDFLRNKGGTPEPPEPGEPTEPIDPSDPNINTAGGGGLYTENGPVTVTRSEFAHNDASEEGGGISIDSFGEVKISDSVIRNNRAGADGGGVENSGFRVTFERLHVHDNYAVLDGGGIYNSSSNPFFVLNSTVERNSAVDGGGLANAPDNDLIIRRSLFLRNVARHPPISEDGDIEEGGHGGGIFSLADGDALIENTTITGNVAATGGGGLFHDADGELKLINLTIWRNSAPRGGGIGVAESDFVPPLPPLPNTAVIVRNSIVGGSVQGGSCDWLVTSEGGNMDTGGKQYPGDAATGEALLPADTKCFMSIAGNSDIGATAMRDRFSPKFTVDAIADNGGDVMTHRLNYGSLAIDAAVTPCPDTDARGIPRPQNGRCDMGAFEFVGDPPPPDDVAPETEFVSGPTQNTWETVQWRFTGSDNNTAQEDLNYECRLYDVELVEEPEIIAPWDPMPPELQWVGCNSPWESELVGEEGMMRFEVRAVDRNDNVDKSPAFRDILPAEEPPNTIILEKPPLTTNSRSATFTFTAEDPVTPPMFMEYECRLDTKDPDMWLECFNPAIFSNLASGQHTIEVRATGGGSELVDPTPARYSWTVAQGDNCDTANVTLTASADGWVNEVVPWENYLFYTELSVATGATGDPDAVPPVPVVGENARSLFRFALPTDAAHCHLESATLRLFNDGPEGSDEGRHDPGHAGRRPVEGEHAHLDEPAGDVGKCRARPATTRSARCRRRPRATWSGTSSATSRRCWTTESATAGRSATPTRAISRTKPSRASSAARPSRTRRPSRGRCPSSFSATRTTTRRRRLRRLSRRGAPVEGHCGHGRDAEHRARGRRDGLSRRGHRHRRAEHRARPRRPHGRERRAVHRRARRTASSPASGTAASRTSSSATAPSRTSATASC